MSTNKIILKSNGKLNMLATAGGILQLLQAETSFNTDWAMTFINNVLPEQYHLSYNQTNGVLVRLAQYDKVYYYLTTELNRDKMMVSVQGGYHGTTTKTSSEVEE